MASATARNLLSKLEKSLVAFQEKPKVNQLVNGNTILGEWFTVGTQVFEDFFHLGNALDWRTFSIKSTPVVTSVIELVTNNLDWLGAYISIYGSNKIDFEGGDPGEVCKFRSGVEFLHKGFSGIQPPFDTILEQLVDSGELEETDRRLKAWVDNGFRPDFSAQDLQLRQNVPQGHWWWY